MSVNVSWRCARSCHTPLTLRPASVNPKWPCRHPSVLLGLLPSSALTYSTASSPSSTSPASSPDAHTRLATASNQTTLARKLADTIPNPTLNPPLATLPATLQLPERDPQSSTLGYWINVGKAYFRFYRDGLRAVRANARAGRVLITRLQAHDPFPPAPLGFRVFGLLGAPDQYLYIYAQEGHLTRAEVQLIRRARSDLRRVPAFALIFAACGEFTPLAVLALPSIVPHTCRIPEQVIKMRHARAKRQRTIRALFEERYTWSVGGGGNAGLVGHRHVSTLEIHQLRCLGSYVGLYPRIWDAFHARGLPLARWLRRRIGRWAADLDVDDKLLREEGGAWALNAAEVRLACEERGLDGVLATAESSSGSASPPHSSSPSGSSSSSSSSTSTSTSTRTEQSSFTESESAEAKKLAEHERAADEDMQLRHLLERWLDEGASDDRQLGAVERVLQQMEAPTT